MWSVRFPAVATFPVVTVAGAPGAPPAYPATARCAASQGPLVECAGRPCVPPVAALVIPFRSHIAQVV